jgi:3-isopropylmalate dehydrogenase
MRVNIALIRGDGIGPEVTAAAVSVINAAAEKFGHDITYREAVAGGAAIDKFGEPLPKQTLDICKASDAVLLGAVGGWQWDYLPGDKRPERALLGLRAELGLYANLRPAVLFNELEAACPLKPEISGESIDILIIRELTGGIYFGDRGRKTIKDDKAAWDTEQYTVSEVRRIAKIGFEAAAKRNKHLTNVDKANVLESSRLWRETVLEVAAEYPDIQLDHLYIDNAAMQLIKRPQSFDVMLTSNMFGDILSDEASQIVGSIGVLPSASLGAGGLGMYEPSHGSAPDIAGKDLANPIAAILSAAMMFQYSFNKIEEARAIENAVAEVLKDGYRTVDIATPACKIVGAKEMTEKIVYQMRRKAPQLSAGI